jgi:hypothetical protein
MAAATRCRPRRVPVGCRIFGPALRCATVCSHQAPHDIGRSGHACAGAMLSATSVARRGPCTRWQVKPEPRPMFCSPQADKTSRAGIRPARSIQRTTDRDTRRVCRAERPICARPCCVDPDRGHAGAWSMNAGRRTAVPQKRIHCCTVCHRDALFSGRRAPPCCPSMTAVY